MNEVTAIEFYEKARRLHERGKLSRAEQFYRKAIKTNKRFAPAHNNLGNVLVDRNRLAEATRAYQDALAHAPGDPRVLNNLGNVFHLRGKSKEAVSLLYTALETDPDYLDALNNLGNALSSLGRFNEATAVYHKAIQLAPNFAQLHLNLGRTLMDSGKLEFAIDSFTQAITLDPNYAQAYYSRGNAFQDLGQFTDATESYQQALQINPSASIVHLALSGLKKYEDTDPHIAVMQNLLGTYRQDDPNRAMLCFALAKAYDDLREVDRSFHYLSEGNRLRSKQLDYDLENDRALVSTIEGLFGLSSSNFNSASDSDLPNIPIFVVGMPRSGTSLVEQILASHGHVYGAGELDTVNRSLRSSIRQGSTQNEAKLEEDILEMSVEQLRRTYFETLSTLNVPERYVVDKMPLNLLWVGFILKALPEAKIVHMKRCPRATCWSIYKQHFSTNELGFAYRLADIAGFYNLYSSLMRFWHARYPGRIYTLEYEELTESQEHETENLLEFCGLEWDPNCLSFHNTKRPVTTASAVQVRQKLYRGSSEKWKNYEKYLDPLLNTLAN